MQTCSGLQTCGGNSIGGGEEGRRDLVEEQKINNAVFNFFFNFNF
jgi:hypothetical protein